VWPKQTSECKNLSLITKCQGGNCNSFVTCLKLFKNSVSRNKQFNINKFKSCNKERHSCILQRIEFSHTEKHILHGQQNILLSGQRYDGSLLNDTSDLIENRDGCFRDLLRYRIYGGNRSLKNI